MTIPEFTIVVGVDRKHMQQLSWVYPTWIKNKPSLKRHPMVVFFDRDQVLSKGIHEVVKHENLAVVPWPPEGVNFSGEDKDKWTDTQRYKMLAGFVHVPALAVKTPYWLKLDTDVVATENDDWIDEQWFFDDPVIISHPWSFTKPAGQMDELDQWAEDNGLSGSPLNLHPFPGWSRLRHKRITSFCAFFRTDFTMHCSNLASTYCGDMQLPVPSQDGFMWFCSARYGMGIVTPSMKALGWEQWSHDGNVKKFSRKAMEGSHEEGSDVR